MPAIPQDLIDESECFICMGVSLEEAVRLADLARRLTDLEPTADTTPNALLAYGKCYVCLGVTMFEAMLLAMLDQISQALGGGAVSDAILTELGDNLVTESGEVLTV